MCGGSGKPKKVESDSGPELTHLGGQEKKLNRPLVIDGKVAPGTKAYENLHNERARRIVRAEYERKLDFEDHDFATKGKAVAWAAALKGRV